MISTRLPFIIMVCPVAGIRNCKRFYRWSLTDDRAGVPCAGEGDLQTAVAMKICDILGVGGSFSEIVVVDYLNETILLGHDGPFHIAIAEGKPILRGMGLYHGKQGTGVSVEAKVRLGPITTLNVTQTGDGKLKFISSQGESAKGSIMQI